MSKDEMIKGMARFPIYAGCSIIGEDEIGIKKSELARLKNLELNYEQVYEEYRKLEQERKSYRKIADNEMVFNAYQLHEEFKKHEQETARAILQELKKEGIMYSHFRSYEHLAISMEKLKVIANKYGIELEN